MKVLHVCAVAFGLESRGLTVGAACSPATRVAALRPCLAAMDVLLELLDGHVLLGDDASDEVADR